ncbi:F-box/WD repeat-containing protein 4 isoform X2 [Hermetia illucens]|uniref:F-box/WD repeat-containing protein 4 isoform X2 n=1 Tax=Hermetia illucens TaxID=343691 RepID=UPI0018CC2522|nr:F-box/WD repeat-containing protein 4 isoform X2 [Hermetia illucens]
MSPVGFCDLNVYVVLKILDYCDESDIENLYFTCSKLQDIIEHSIYYRRSLDLIMTGHKGNSANCKRYSYRERIKMNENWINGRYRELVLFHHRKWYPSKVLLESDLFYMSHAGAIRVHKRTRNEAVDRRYLCELSSLEESDISHFTKKGNTIFAGRVCGSCFIYEDNYLTEQRLHGIKEYLTCVDFIDSTFITSTDKTTKLWSKSIELGLINFELVKDFKEPYKCLRISESGDKIACGMYTDFGRRALREIDIETGTKRIFDSNTLSIYDLRYKDENTILTANFDTTFRMFDRRTNRDEIIWMDPYDASFYCLEYDGLYGVVCGMKHFCRVNLYDIRVPRKFMQMYFPALRRSQGSPVYSVTCDSRYLFVVTDHNLRVLDFKADWATVRDYRNIFVNI